MNEWKDLDHRWSGWPRRQTVFWDYQSDYDYFLRPLSSDHQRFRRYRSLLLL